MLLLQEFEKSYDEYIGRKTILNGRRREMLNNVESMRLSNARMAENIKRLANTYVLVNI